MIARAARSFPGSRQRRRSDARKSVEPGSGRGDFGQNPMSFSMARNLIRHSPPGLPLAGRATYVGAMGGLYTYNYGRAWGELAGSTEVTEFSGPVSLTADFDRNRLTVCLGRPGPIETAPGRRLAPAVPWGADDPARCPPTTMYASKPRLTQAERSRVPPSPWRIPTGAIVKNAGTWQKQFSNMPDVDGSPRRAAGSTDVLFAEDDGSHGRFTGIFDALTPATVAPPEG